MPKSSRIALGLGTMYIAWGTTYIGIALTIETMPDLLAMGLRFATASLVMFLVSGIRSGFAQFRITRRQLRNTIFLGTTMNAVGIGTVSASEHVVPVGVTSLMIASMPLWTVVLRTINHDRPRARTFVGVAVGFIGLLIIMRPGQTLSRDGASTEKVLLWLCVLLVGNFLWSFGSFVTPRLDLPTRIPVLTSYQLLSASVALVGAGLVSGQSLSSFTQASGRSWFGWWYLVSVGTLLGLSVYVWLLNNAPISLVSTYSYVNPVVATALAWLVYDEPVTVSMWTGGSLVIIAVATIAWSERVRATASDVSPLTVETN